MRNDHDPFHAGQRFEEGVRTFEAVYLFAAVKVTVRGEQHFRLDLSETVEHALDAEIGGAAGPDGADRRRGEHRDHRLRHVRHEARDTVALDDAGRTQRLGDTRDLVVQVGVAERPAPPGLVAENQGGAVVAIPQQVLGVVQFRPAEPARAVHRLARFVDRRGRGMKNHTAVLREQTPERRRVGQRPVIQRFVIRKLQGVPLIGHPPEGCQVGLGDLFRFWSPEGGVHSGRLLLCASSNMKIGALLMDARYGLP